MHGVGLDVDGLVVGLRDQRDLLANQPRQHLIGVLQRAVEVEGDGLGFLLLAEAQKFSGNKRGSARGVDDLLRVLPGLGRLWIRDDEAGVAIDNGQQVVEIVRDGTREPPDRLHFLRVVELFVEHLALVFHHLALDRGNDDILAEQDVEQHQDEEAAQETNRDREDNRHGRAAALQQAVHLEQENQKSARAYRRGDRRGKQDNEDFSVQTIFLQRHTPP